MTKNEQNKPDEVKTASAQEATAEEKTTPAPISEIGGEADSLEKTAEKAAALPNKGEATRHESDSPACRLAETTK